MSEVPLHQGPLPSDLVRTNPSLATDGTRVQKAYAKPLSGTTNLPVKKSPGDAAVEFASDKQLAVDSLEAVADSIEEAVYVLNQALKKSPTQAVIQRDEELNRFIIRIADKASGEVIREVPSEAVLKFARNLEEMKGLLFDKTL
ncbi:flagellar protein FlaG [Luminiphilus sp.]|nr:flagellar protein FlaG [Luminiphilus sp.]